MLSNLILNIMIHNLLQIFEYSSILSWDFSMDHVANYPWPSPINCIGFNHAEHSTMLGRYTWLSLDATNVSLYDFKCTTCDGIRAFAPISNLNTCPPVCFYVGDSDLFIRVNIELAEKYVDFFSNVFHTKDEYGNITGLLYNNDCSFYINKTEWFHMKPYVDNFNSPHSVTLDEWLRPVMTMRNLYHSSSPMYNKYDIVFRMAAKYHSNATGELPMRFLNPMSYRTMYKVRHSHILGSVFRYENWKMHNYHVSQYITLRGISLSELSFPRVEIMQEFATCVFQ